VAGTPKERAAEARAALRAIVADPAHGTGVLSRPRETANLLKDLLPDAPREASILVAAAETGIADALRDHVTQGMDCATAMRLAAVSFADATGFTPEACDWAVREVALALGLNVPDIAAAGAGAEGGTTPPPTPPSLDPSEGRDGQDAGVPSSPGSPAPGWPQPQPGPAPAGQGFQGPPAPGWQPAPAGAGFQGPPTAGWPPPVPADPGFQPRQAPGWQQPGPVLAGQGAYYQQAPGPPPPGPATAGPGVQGTSAGGYPQAAGPASGGTAPQVPPGWHSLPPGMPPSGKRPRTRLAAIVAGLAAVVTAAVAVFVFTQSPPPPPPVVTVSAASASMVGRYVVVAYLGGKHATATITANVSRAEKGEVAKLVAQPFPYRGSPAPVASTKITGRRQRVSFRVTPSLATRYHIEVFASPSAGTPLATSAEQMIYVTQWYSVDYTHKACSDPDCQVTASVLIRVPPVDLRREAAKHGYFYFGFSRSLLGTPATPKVLALLGSHSVADATISPPKFVSADEYQQTVSLVFDVGVDSARWELDTCVRDTVSADGLGLPGHHHCGDPSISASLGYLG
jgi:hypothetical protein